MRRESISLQECGLRGPDVARLQEKLPDLPPGHGAVGAGVAVVHRDLFWLLAGLSVVLLCRLEGNRAHEIDDRVHGN